MILPYALYHVVEQARGICGGVALGSELDGGRHALLHARGGNEGAFALDACGDVLAVLGEDAGRQLFGILEQPAVALHLADPQLDAGLVDRCLEECERRAPGQAEDETGQDERLALDQDLPELEQADLVVIVVGLGGRLGVLHGGEVIRGNPDYLT